MRVNVSAKHRWSLVAMSVTMAIVASGCTDRSGRIERSDQPAPASLCAVYDDIDWDDTYVPETYTDDEAAAKVRRLNGNELKIVQAAPVEIKELAELVLAAGKSHRDRLLQERTKAGGGAALARQARRRGFFSQYTYIQSLLDADERAQSRQYRRLFALLARECDADYRPTDLVPLKPENAPAGELLVAKLDHAEIRRFSTTGMDLGALPLPSAVEAPIRDLMLSPNGRHLAFRAGENPWLTWFLDLRNGKTSSMTGNWCMDWSDEGSDELWGLFGAPPDQVAAPFFTDGTYDPEAGLSVVGCPYRFDTDSVVMHRSTEDGTPELIEIVPKDGGPPAELVSSPCALVFPRVSPDAEQLLLTAACGTQPAGGVFVVDVDGQNLHQVFGGFAFSATWSPDGKWIVFGVVAPDGSPEADEPRVAVSTADGRSLGVVTPVGYAWPVWIPSTYAIDSVTRHS